MSRPDSNVVLSVVLALPGPRESIAPATEFRSTWVVSSLEGLRAQGHLDRYLSLVDPMHRDAILSCVAGAWLPMATVVAHYRACEALALSPEQVTAMARDGGNVRRAWHATIIAAAQRPDANIWMILQQLHKIWMRGANGGAVAVYRLGETRARVEYVGCELFDIPYFCDAVGAVLRVLGMHLCPALRVTEVASNSRGSAHFLIDWAN